MREGVRAYNKLRKVKITPNFSKYAEGSCLIELGNTKVVCTATHETKVPPFLRDKGSGWVTAEYGMLPRSCTQRIVREAARGKLGGRTHEIQRRGRFGLIVMCFREMVVHALQALLGGSLP